MEQFEGYRIKESDGVQYVSFDHIEECGLYSHGFSCRNGGVSYPPYDTLNLGFNTEDLPENLQENKRRFLKAIGIDHLFLKQQIDLVHGNLVLNLNQLPRDGTLIKADGIVTNQSHQILVTTFADCIPIFIADPQNKAFGVIHAGWRGIIAGIAQSAIIKMKNDFGTKLEDILVGIGPGIGRCCFEVGKNVADAFFDKFQQWQDLIVKLSNKEKWNIDLLKLSKRILQEMGINKENIIVAGLCTFCHKDLFFSYRRDGKFSGRLAAVMARIT